MPARPRRVSELIDEMVRRIVEGFDPDRIILFGSHARGAGRPDSDVDLMVIMPVKGSRRRLATEIDLSLVGVDLPADVIVLTPEQASEGRGPAPAGIGGMPGARTLYERPKP